MKKLNGIVFVLALFSLTAFAKPRHHAEPSADAQQEFNDERELAARNASTARVQSQDQWAMEQMAATLQENGRNPAAYGISPDKYHSTPIQPTAYAVSKDHSEKCEYYYANNCGGQSSYGSGGFGSVDCGVSHGHLSCYSHGQQTAGEGSLHTRYQGITSAPAGAKVY